MRWPKTSGLVVLMLLIAGCGFHLRGIVDVPTWLNNVNIITQHVHRDITPMLKDQLQAYHIDVNPNPSTASYWLFIESDSFQQHITSVSSSTTPRQYLLVYTLRFKLQKAKGPEIIPSSQTVITRQITINSDRILGSNYEEELVKRDMRQDAVIQLINRISRSTPKINPKHAH